MIYRRVAIPIRLKGRCGVVVSRNVVVTQIRSDPGSIPGISTHFFVLLEIIKCSGPKQLV